jgi:hypothetical protein
MDTSKPIIICGSGNSISFLNSQFYRTGCGLPTKLEQIIKNNYSIGLNYWFQYGCETTFNCSGDWQFYIDNIKELKKIPMIIASEDPQLKNNKISRIHDNTILLKHNGKYFGLDSWKHGFYSRQLISLFSLTLAIALGFKEIYLLGIDAKEINGQTHFYQGIADLNTHKKIYIKGELKDKRYKFRGIGRDEKGNYKTSTYNYPDTINNQWYKPYLIEKNIEIYNVSPDSAVTIFPKLTYKEFYEKMENNQIVQEEAREEIRNFILEKLK